jgi:hypothetical protein
MVIELVTITAMVVVNADTSANQPNHNLCSAEEFRTVRI